MKKKLLFMLVLGLANLASGAQAENVSTHQEEIDQVLQDMCLQGEIIDLQVELEIMESLVDNYTYPQFDDFTIKQGFRNIHLKQINDLRLLINSPGLRDSKGQTALISALGLSCTLPYSGTNLSDRVVLGLLQQGYDLNGVDDSGQTALWRAAFVNTNENQVRLLLAYGADPNRGIFNGLTLLEGMIECQNDPSSQKIANLLREYGAQE